MADIFSVIADPTRRHVLSLLLERYVASDLGDAAADAAPPEASPDATAPDAAAPDSGASEAAAPDGAPMGEVSVSELVALLELSQPTVSKHLKVLRDAGLVTVREVGQHRYYALESAPLEEVEDWLIPFLSADFDEGVDEDGIDFEDELDELVSRVAGSAADVATSAGSAAASVVSGVASSAKSSASKAGELAGQRAAAAAERARALFGGAARRFPTIARGSD